MSVWEEDVDGKVTGDRRQKSEVRKTVGALLACARKKNGMLEFWEIK